MEIEEGIKILAEYFDLSNDQKNLFVQLGHCLENYNAQVNVISRKDLPFLFERHILHSLSLAKLNVFTPGSLILDLGTGGGFPGLPLAILHPECSFILIDSTKKKIRIVESLIKNLNLQNVEAQAVRAEDYRNTRLQWVISRAVAPAALVRKWGLKICHTRGQSVNPGFLLLKGGDLQNEIADLPVSVQLTPIQKFFNRPFFQEKFIVRF